MTIIFLTMLHHQTLLVDLLVATKFKTDLIRSDDRHILLVHCSLIMVQDWLLQLDVRVQ